MSWGTGQGFKNGAKRTNTPSFNNFSVLITTFIFLFNQTDIFCQEIIYLSSSDFIGNTVLSLFDSSTTHYIISPSLQTLTEDVIIIGASASLRSRVTLLSGSRLGFENASLQVTNVDFLSLAKDEKSDGLMENYIFYFKNSSIVMFKNCSFDAKEQGMVFGINLGRLSFINIKFTGGFQINSFIQVENTTVFETKLLMVFPFKIPNFGVLIKITNADQVLVSQCSLQELTFNSSLLIQINGSQTIKLDDIKLSNLALANSSLFSVIDVNHSVVSNVTMLMNKFYKSSFIEGRFDSFSLFESAFGNNTLTESYFFIFKTHEKFSNIFIVRGSFYGNVLEYILVSSSTPSEEFHADNNNSQEVLFKSSFMGFYFKTIRGLYLGVSYCIFRENTVESQRTANSDNGAQVALKNTSSSCIFFDFCQLLYNNFNSNLFWLEGTSNLVINNTQFEKNSLCKDSTLVNFNGESLSLINIRVIGNYAPQGDGFLFWGRSILFNQSQILLNDFSNGLIFSHFPTLLHLESKAVLINMAVLLNKSNKSALALSVIGNFTMHIDRGLFASNVFQDVGGIVKLGCWKITKKFLILIENAVFKDLTALGAAAVFSKNIKGNIFIRECKFLNNTSLKYGGAFIITSESGSYFTLFECLFISNKAIFEGGVAECILCNFYDYKSGYEGNSASQASTIFASSYSIIFFIKSLIKNSLALKSNNMMFVGYCNVSLENVSFVGSYSVQRSACVSVYGYANVNIKVSLFFNNSARFGTIIFSSNSNNTISLKNCLLRKNKAEGSLFFINRANLKLEKMLSFENNGTLLLVAGAQNISLIDILIFRDYYSNKRTVCLLLAQDVDMLVASKVFMIGLQAKESYLIKITLSSFTFNETFSYNSSTSDASLVKIENSNGSFSQDLFTRYNSTVCAVFNSTVNFSENIYFSNEVSVRGLSKALELLMSSFVINSSIFITNKALAIKISQQADSINKNLMTKCLFINNSNFKLPGGAVIILNSRVIIEFNIFQGNKAEIAGGGLFIEYDRESDTGYELELLFNIFLLNEAIKGGGGAFFWVSTKPLKEVNNSFINNLAAYGPDFCSQPKFLVLEYSYFTFGNSISNHISGTSIPQLNILLKDFYNQTLLIDSQHGAKISVNLSEASLLSKNSSKNENGTGKPFILGKTTVSLTKGRFVFTDLKLIALPETFLKLYIQSDNVSFSIGNQSHFNVTSMTVDVYVSRCQNGQIFNKDKLVCEDCNEGSYSLLHSFDGVCKPCPANAICLGGNRLNLKKNYWRGSLKSEKLYECRTQDICTGGFEDICEKGFGGKLCGVCTNQANLTYNEDSLQAGLMEGVFFLDMDKKCKPCSAADIKKSIIVGSLIFLGTLIYTIFLIKDRLQNRLTSSSALLKILTDFLQIVSLLKSAKLRWTINIQPIFRIFETLNNPDEILLGVDCYLIKVLSGEVNLYFKKVFLTTVICFLIPISNFVFWAAYGKLKKLSFTLIRSKISLSVSIAFFTYQPMFIKYYFDALLCVQIEDKWYIGKYLSEECWTPSHLNLVFAFILPSLLVLIVIYPLRLLFKMKTSQKNGKFAYDYSFLTNSYLNTYYSWDFLNMIQKFLLVLVSVFIISELNILMGNLLITSIFAYLQFLFTPYKITLINHIASLSRVSSTIIVISLLLNYSSNGSKWLEVLSFFTFLFAYLVFFFVWIKAYLIYDKTSLDVVRKILFCFEFKIVEARNTSSLMVRARHTDRKRSRKFLRPLKKLFSSNSEIQVFSD